MKIISWNVNSVRARIENILEYIKITNPDIDGVVATLLSI